MSGLRVLHLMSCRGWSSDAYWAGRIACELGQRGPRVTFVAREGTEARVLRRLRDLGLPEVQTLGFRGRRAPRAMIADVNAIRRLVREHDVVRGSPGASESWVSTMRSCSPGSPTRPRWPCGNSTWPSIPRSPRRGWDASSSSTWRPLGRSSPPTVGVAPEILAHGESALLVPPGDADALARAVIEMLESPDDAARMGGTARRLVEQRYSGAVVAAAVEASYLEALGTGGVASR